MGVSSVLKKALTFLVPNKKQPDFTSAVIVAGGSSSRMGEGVSKQLLNICGIPTVVHTLLAFERTPEIDEIIIVAKSDEIELYEEFKKTYRITKLKKAVVGGKTRQQSASKGFAAISEKSRYVAIHDAARCLVSPEDISAVCVAAYTYGAATAATPATDTIKLADANGFIEKTIDRTTVWHAQTPQIFDADIYRAALAVCARDGVEVTDDNSLVEYIERPVKLIECSRDNIKITTPADVAHARAVLKKRSGNKEAGK